MGASEQKPAMMSPVLALQGIHTALLQPKGYIGSTG